MDDPGSNLLEEPAATTPGTTSEDEDIAFAAEAAANAVAAADAEQQRLDESLLACRICGSRSSKGRPVVRFLPVEHDMAAAKAAPAVQSFTEDIALHIFCGKTASILSAINRPELEILTKAGLKNKHGIGPEVNAALARTRCAILLEEAPKEKHYYLVREFEAHLAAIRHTHIAFVPDPNNPPINGAVGVNGNPQIMSYNPLPYPNAYPTNNHNHLPPPHMLGPTTAEELVSMQSISPTQPLQPPLHINNTNGHHFYPADFLPPLSQKILPIRAAAGMVHKPQLSSSASIHRRQGKINHQKEQQRRQERQQEQLESVEAPQLLGRYPPLLPPQQQPQQSVGPNGKVRCCCGGTHWPFGTAKGDSSWRNHCMTKRHQKWLENNGLLGAI